MSQGGRLEDLATFFSRPARSGVYVTKNELIALARLSEASLRVNERPRMLLDVLRSPQTPEELAALFERLATFARASLEAYEGMIRDYPACEPALRDPCERARRTIERLELARAELLGTGA